MATMTLKPKTNTAAPVAAAEPEVETKQLAVAEDTTLATPSSPLSAGVGVEGEITQEDIVTPRINLVQKSGQLVDNYAPGTFLFEKLYVVAEPAKSFYFVPLRLKKYYQEKLEYGVQGVPRKCSTAAEVRALGGTTDYDLKDELPYFQDVADILLAVQCPENIDEEAAEHFPYNDGEHNYGLAIYTVASSAYTSLGKRLLTDSAILLKGGLFTGKYEVHSEIRKNEKNSWHVPVAKFAGKNSNPEFFKSLAGL